MKIVDSGIFMDGELLVRAPPLKKNIPTLTFTFESVEQNGY